MILLKSDWQRYPNAIADFRTPNKSALELALKLQSMGIENCTFFLALHNPKLQGVDPHDPKLTVEQMVMVGMECRENPWYFFREVARAPANAGLVGNRVQYNRANVSMWWSFFLHITYILVQPRQTGKSFCVDLLMTELYGFYCTNTQINLLTKDDRLRSENVKRLKSIYEELPSYLNMKTRDDVNNMEEISLKKLGNYYLTHVPQSSPKRAANLGRGLTTPILQFDEAPFQPHIKIAMQAATGAMGAAIDAAIRNNEPYGVLMTTTAGKKDDRDGRYIYEYAMEAARWSDRFYDAKTTKELEQMVRRHSKGKNGGVNRIYGCFSYKQLGKDDLWMRRELERTGGDPDDANRDFFNVWTSGSLSAPLPTAILDALASHIRDEDYQHISTIGSYITRWYIPEDSIEQYMHSKKTVVGIDTSDAIGRDGISFVLTDVETGNVVAVGEFNELNLIKFAQWLVDFIVRYVNTTVVVERRSSGATIIDYLLMFLPQHNIDPFKRLFNWVVNDHMEHKERFEEARLPMTRREHDVYVRCKKYFGFATAGSGDASRDELYGSNLQSAARRCIDKVHDRNLTEQITSLENRNGRVDHPKGGHDDLVIGWLLCHWFLTKGKNLQHYGIDSRIIFSANQPKQVLQAAEAYFEQEQQELRQRITELFEKMSHETDGFIIQRYERELRYLDSRLVLKDGEYFSIDAVVNQAKEERKKAHINTMGYQPRSYIEQLGYGRAQSIDGLSGGAMSYYG